MVGNFVKSWGNAPRDLRGLLIVLTLIFSVSSAIAISRSDKVQVDRDGFTISKQAIANQKELEKAFLTIQTQQAAIEQHQDVTEAFTRRYPAAQEILDSAEHVADLVPDTTIDDIEKTIDASQLLLHSDGQ